MYIMNSKDYKYFNIAKSLSMLSSFSRYHIGACIVRKNDIISVGYNQNKTHPMQKKYNVYRFHNLDNCKNFIHAEMEALVKVLDKDLSDSSIYVYRENMKGEKAICRPCKACMQALKDYGISKIFYTTENGYCEEIIGE